MFSPDASVQGSVSVRNPRRRQRTTSDDFVAIRENPKRRKRSLLAPDTFEAPAHRQGNGHLHHGNGDAVYIRHVSETPSHRDASVDTASLAIRNRSTQRLEKDKRGSKTDEGVVLVHTDAMENDYSQC